MSSLVSQISHTPSERRHNTSLICRIFSQKSRDLGWSFRVSLCFQPRLPNQENQEEKSEVYSYFPKVAGTTNQGLINKPKESKSCSTKKSVILKKLKIPPAATSIGALQDFTGSIDHAGNREQHNRGFFGSLIPKTQGLSRQ